MAIINASIDNVSYNDIDEIVVGGKNVLLSAIESGSDLPECIAEIKYGTYTQESDSSSTKSFSHGCAGAPDIIVMWSDFKTRYTSQSTAANTIIVGACYNGVGGFHCFSGVQSGYSGNTGPTAFYIENYAGEGDGQIVNVGSSTFDVLFKSNRRCGGGLKYEWLAIRLQGVS